MILRFKDRTFDFHVDAPPSKSVYHRELIIRFLLGAEDNLDPDGSDGRDIAATRNCLRALRGQSLLAPGEDIVLDCDESGSTLRFMIPVAAAYKRQNGIGRNIVFRTAGRLYDRPLGALADCLRKHGVSIEGNDRDRTFTLRGYLSEGRFTIDGSVSSQYVSGLMMALLIMPSSELQIIGTPASVHYIELTRSIIAKYEGKTADEIPTELTVEGDWSAGAFLLCLDRLIDGHVDVGNLDEDSVQGDKKIRDFLAACGTSDELTWDCRDIPDIVPYMAVVAAYENKVTVFDNIDRLRQKESDRVEAITEQLAAVGIRTKERADTLTVYGKEEAYSKDTVTLKSYNDHRMVMTAMLIAAANRCDLDIDSIDPVDKSFPGLRTIINGEFS